VRTQVDALLSVRRWVVSVLPGPPWRVLLAGDEGRTERPYAVVSTADGASGAHDGPETVRMVLPIVVQAFPPVGRRPSHSKLIAERVAAALEAAIRVGVPDYHDAAVRGARQRIPLWDYSTEVATMEGLVSEDVLASPSVTRNRPDYLFVPDGWKAQSLPQVDTGDLFVATLEARVQWLAPTGVPAPGAVLQQVRQSVTASETGR
jgi:hypothetical protein